MEKESPSASLPLPAERPATPRLSALRGERTAPELQQSERQELLAELQGALKLCPWFTIGVMAPTASEAVEALRRCEQALGWPALTADNPDAAASEGPVFLKGNQRTGTYRIRQEEGLGKGVLISGQNSEQPELADTWGPLPLDLL
jgi:Domain of unknown function (DUF1824)